MGNNWKNIWNNRQSDVVSDDGSRSEFEIFCELKRADGFDVAVSDAESYYRNFYNEFDRYSGQLKELIGETGSVFEVGCGSGVNLFLFKRRFGCIVGGIDYSESLVECARKILGDEEIICGEAVNVKKTPQYDVVMAEGVFEYFESLDYAESVVELMIAKSRKLVYIGGAYDKAKEEEMMAYRRSMIPDYDNRYKGLDKCFYPKEWFEELAERSGRAIMFTEVRNPEYLNAKYQYKCYIYRDDK